MEVVSIDWAALQTYTQRWARRRESNMNPRPPQSLFTPNVLRNHPVRAALRSCEAGRCFLGHAHFYFFLASRGCGAQRSWLVGLLRRRHFRTGSRKGSALVHPGRDAVFLCGARCVRRELLDVHPRRRLPGRERSAGREFREAQCVGVDVRLHPDRSDLGRFRGTVHCRADERIARRGSQIPMGAAGAGALCPPRLPDQRDIGDVCGGGDDLLLVAKHQGHRRVDRQGAECYADHYRDGGVAAGLGVPYCFSYARQTATVTHSCEPAFFIGCPGIPGRHKAGFDAGAVWP
jgi:hypothetical protein